MAYTIEHLEWLVGYYKKSLPAGTEIHGVLFVADEVPFNDASVLDAEIADLMVRECEPAEQAAFEADPEKAAELVERRNKAMRDAYFGEAR
jgi:hypothetical protein